MKDVQKTILLSTMLLLLLAAAWLTQTETPPAPEAPLATEAQTYQEEPQATPRANDSIAAIVQAATATDSTFTPGAHPSLLLKFVATGEVSALPLSETVTATVIQAYTTRATGELLEVPIALALTTGDTTYGMTWPTPGQVISPDELAAQTKAFPRGRLFSATLFDFVSPAWVDWAVCGASPYPGEPLCTFAHQQQSALPDVEARLLTRTLAEIPPGWLLLGWGLTPFTPANATLWEVALP